jgi:hypothetical protein
MWVRWSKVSSLLVLVAAVSCWGQTQQGQAQQEQAQQEQAQPQPAQQKPEIKIGFSLEATKGERWQTDLDEF